MNMTSKDCSFKQEQQIAKLLNGKVQAASGGTRFGGGDVHTKDFMIEAKTPTVDKESFTIKSEWMDKLRQQAFQQRKSFRALAFRFGPNQPDYYVIDEHLMCQVVKMLDAK